MEDAFLYYTLRAPRRTSLSSTSANAGIDNISTSSPPQQLSPLSRTASILSQALASPLSFTPQRVQSHPVASPSQNLAPPHAHSFLAHTLCLAHIFSHGAIIRLHRPFAFPYPRESWAGDYSGAVQRGIRGDAIAGLGGGRSGRRLGPKRHVESVLKAARDMAGVIQLLGTQGIQPQVMCMSVGVSNEHEWDRCD